MSADLRVAHDPAIALIFKQLRAVIGLNETALARQIGTDISVVMDLEAGLIDRFPDWPETARIVGHYGRLAAVDTAPLMTRLRALQTAPAPSTAPVPAPQPYVRAPLALSRPVPARPAPVAIDAVPVPRTDVYARSLAASSPRRAVITAPVAPPPDAAVMIETPDDGDLYEPAPLRRRRFRLRRAAFPVLAIAIIAGAFFLMQSAPRALYSFAGVLPAALNTPTRGVVDFVVYQTAPVKDGLRWIDVGDPRLRKADRKPLP